MPPLFRYGIYAAYRAAFSLMDSDSTAGRAPPPCRRLSVAALAALAAVVHPQLFSWLPNIDRLPRPHRLGITEQCAFNDQARVQRMIADRLRLRQCRRPVHHP